MIEHCEREQFVNVKAGKATSGRLERSDRDLVATLKRHLFSCPLSPAVLLLGSLIIFSPLIEGGTTHLPVLIMRLILLGALIAWTMYRMRLGRDYAHPESSYSCLSVVLRMGGSLFVVGSL